MKTLNLLLIVCQGALSGLAQQAVIAVAEKKAGEVGFYAADGRRLSGVSVGRYPHELVYSPEKKFIYVSDNGLLWMTDPGGGGNTISIIDVATRKKAGVIDLGTYHRPHGMAIDPATGRMIVTIENPDGLLLIDPVARKVLRKFDVQGKNPHMTLFGPGGKTAYVSNTNSSAVAVIDVSSGKVLKLIPASGRPQGGVLTRDGKRIYLTHTDGNQISIIDTAKHEVVGTISTGEGPARIALTPDEKTLVYNLQAGSAIGFADVATGKQTSVVKLPGLPLSLSLTPDGKTAYLGLQDSDKIAIVSVPDRKIIRIIDTPKNQGPDSILPLP